MASTVVADPTHALQGTNQGIRSAMEVSENDLGSLEQLSLYADEHYLAGKLSLPLVYADKPQTLDILEDNIRRVIADMRPQMLEKVIENWTSRLDYIRASRGSPMPEIIFKM
ncbi:hypothetical protein TNCV_1890531 [Trichonephila clavipes]|nr:hypothetical protein TNCV_1890531 [Trichonephila clavipes]